MTYRYKVKLARKTSQKKNHLLSDIIEKLTLPSRSAVHRSALKELFLDHDPSLFRAVPEIRLQGGSQHKTLLDQLRKRVEDPLELSFFKRSKLFSFLSWKRSFATALVFTVTFAGFIGITSKKVQAAAEQPQTNPQVLMMKGNLEFLPTDCPPIMQLSNCVKTPALHSERTQGIQIAQYPGPGPGPGPGSGPGTHANTHSNTDVHSNGAHTNTGATHTNTSHVNLAPGDMIF